ncbi:glycosyltransferase family 50 protein [Moelleriella libera RCEF 2490]|uniref:GPI mannosyltransferase 1 n=1 Tax=Moelleriella libera RCEF 2490 TaxID=1081109 RepID=A0A167XKL1_9HYPO|nr:glycosyltransferase family 50 protein [Moelleriella libera RCEF 2490]
MAQPPPSPFPFALFRPWPLFSIALVLRVALLAYGHWQDTHSALKYTDIDYLVFTDAARLVAASQSPYRRDTYRYTPLLAWLLVPTAFFFSFGKVVFLLSDILAGWLILRVLRGSNRGVGGGGSSSMTDERAGMYAAIWLWNPMVATISTRGSAEGLLGVLAVGLLWAVESRRFTLAGVVLGLGVHFKIYPFIWAPAIIWWMDDEHLGKPAAAAAAAVPPPSPQPRDKTRKEEQRSSLVRKLSSFASPERLRLAVVSFATFMGLNTLMYLIYGNEFLVHTYFHHVTRVDHRHNFSPYNTVLYLASAKPSSASFHAESLAFLPQLLLSCVLIPLVLAKKDLATSMLAQTFAFVTFNKVCTSQYFLWYMIFLPLYLPGSTLLHKPAVGMVALVLWVASQAAWLQQGYQLEFLGRSTFFPGLWLSSLVFFLVNCWILGIIISDGAMPAAAHPST